MKWRQRGTVKVSVAGRMVVRWIRSMHKMVIINYIADTRIKKRQIVQAEGMHNRFTNKRGPLII